MSICKQLIKMESINKHTLLDKVSFNKNNVYYFTVLIPPWIATHSMGKTGLNYYNYSVQKISNRITSYRQIIGNSYFLTDL